VVAVVVDITHERNLLQGVLVERAAARVGLEWVSGRGRWVHGSDSFRAVLEAEGMLVESVELVDKVPGKPNLVYDEADVDAQFDFITNSPLATGFVWPEGAKEKVREVFREEWKGASKDGKLEIVDSLYLYIARKV
jgi:hypothetical protein